MPAWAGQKDLRNFSENVDFVEILEASVDSLNASFLGAMLTLWNEADASMHSHTESQTHIKQTRTSYLGTGVAD